MNVLLVYSPERSEELVVSLALETIGGVVRVAIGVSDGEFEGPCGLLWCFFLFARACKGELAAIPYRNGR